MGTLMSMGFVGFAIMFAIWAILTAITGYFLGKGIWAAMPSELKSLMYLTAEAAASRGRR